MSVLEPTVAFLGYQDPGDTLPYVIDLSQYIPPSDTITAATFTMPVGITVSDSGFDAGARTATVWLTAGDANTLASVEMQIGSTDGRVIQRTLLLQVREL